MKAHCVRGTAPQRHRGEFWEARRPTGCRKQPLSPLGVQASCAPFPRREPSGLTSDLNQMETPQGRVTAELLWVLQAACWGTPEGRGGHVGPACHGRPDALSLTALRGAHAPRCRRRAGLKQGGARRRRVEALDVGGRGKAGALHHPHGAGACSGRFGSQCGRVEAVLAQGSPVERLRMWGMRARWRLGPFPSEQAAAPRPLTVLCVEATGFAEHTAVPTGAQTRLCGPQPVWERTKGWWEIYRGLGGLGRALRGLCCGR